MIAKFTKEAQKELNIWKEWKIYSFEIEPFRKGKHYTVKVEVMDYSYNKILIDSYNIDFIENKKEILEYFLN